MEKSSDRNVPWWEIVLFVVYLAGLCYFLFFAESLGRGASGNYRYNLVPFREIMRFVRYRHTIGAGRVALNIFGNIAAFVPFGLFLKSLSKGKMRLGAVFLLSAECSVIVEVLQLLTTIGSCDIDDVILNTCGGVLGGVCYRLFAGKKSRSETDEQ